MKRFIVMATASLLLMFTDSVKADVYTFDKAHMEIGFKVKHMVIANVKGAFTEFDGEFSVKDGKLAGINATVAVKSINTRIAKRDDHLRSKDFF